MEIFEILKTVGIGGIFLISFISNLVPYSALPYLAFITAYSIAAPEARMLIVVAGGLGASLGKVVLYLISEYIGSKIGEKRRQNIEYMKMVVGGKSAFIAILLFAALPLPDDVLYIPLGVIRYRFISFFVPLIIGKTLLVGFFTFLGSRARALLEYSIQSGFVYISVPLMIFATIEIIFIAFFVNWLKVYSTYQESGLRNGIKVLMEETVLVLKFSHPELRSWMESRRKSLQSKKSY